LNEPRSSHARLVGIVVFLLVLALGELLALILNYQNNFFLRQYVSDNFALTVEMTAGLLLVAAGISYLVSLRMACTKPSVGARVRVFGRIGSCVGRRWKLIIIFWTPRFVASLPLSQQLSKLVTSNTSGGQSSTSESAKAANLLAQEFPQPKANTSAIILLQGGNVTDNATKKFTP